MTAVSLDTGFSMGWAAREITQQCILQGNLDPLVLQTGGAALEEAVYSIFTAMENRPFIFNLGHGIVPDTPIAHVEHLCQLIRSQ